jgi:hypothetical protein
MKSYANAIIAVVILLIIGAVLGERWYHGEQRFKAGKDEVQTAWDKDKAARKAESDQQAEDTLNKNKGNEDALNQTQADLRDSRSRLAFALKRLRELKALPGNESVFVAGSGQTAVPGVAGDTFEPGVGVGQRIGSCLSSGSEPCFVSRGFFDQAVSDADDRRLTRAWAAGQGIKTVGNKGE